MGRIRTTLVKRVAKEYINSGKAEFTTDFDKNKELLKSVATFPTKRLRNRVAGYITRLMKTMEKEAQQSTEASPLIQDSSE